MGTPKDPSITSSRREWAGRACTDALRTLPAELEAAFELLTGLLPPTAAICRALQAQVALAQLRISDAREHATEALNLGRDTDTVAAMELALTTQAMLARVDGDAHAAEDLLHEALDLACQVGHRPFACDILDALGGAVGDQGRFDEAARVLAASQVQRDAMGYQRYPMLESVHEASGAAVRRALGDDAFEKVRSEGAALSFDDAVAYARRGRGERKRPTFGWASLTPTEVRVVELVAEGLSNRKIGEKLFVAPGTVKNHLAHVFSKLGVSTRAELAALAVEHRSTDP